MADDDITPAPAVDERAAQRQTSGKAIAALACGILSFPIGFFVGPLVLPLSIAALILGRIARKEIAANPAQDGDGAALAGYVLGIIGVVLGVLFLILILLAFTAFDLYDF
jgi:hypothetical protein